LLRTEQHNSQAASFGVGEVDGTASGPPVPNADRGALSYSKLTGIGFRIHHGCAAKSKGLDDRVKTMSVSWIATGCMVLLACPAFAHHGAAAFDMTTPLTLHATVTEFRFANPHAQIFFEAADSDGKVLRWTAEANGPNALRKHGWSKDIIKSGDHITIIGNRAKNGSTSLHLRKVILSDGRVLDPGGEPPH
jgi:hypothetical protein